MTDGEAYAEGMMYEVFIRRAFKSRRNPDIGAEQTIMHNLIRSENGMDLTRHIGTTDEQVYDIKQYMDKALTRYLELPLSPDERINLNQLYEQLPQSFDSQQLMKLVREGLAITQRFKEH